MRFEQKWETERTKRHEKQSEQVNVCGAAKEAERRHALCQEINKRIKCNVLFILEHKETTPNKWKPSSWVRSVCTCSMQTKIIDNITKWREPIRSTSISSQWNQCRAKHVSIFAWPTLVAMRPCHRITFVENRFVCVTEVIIVENVAATFVDV